MSVSAPPARAVLQPLVAIAPFTGAVLARVVVKGFLPQFLRLHLQDGLADDLVESTVGLLGIAVHQLIPLKIIIMEVVVRVVELRDLVSEAHKGDLLGGQFDKAVDQSVPLVQEQV